MKIDLNELKTVLDAILDHIIETRGIESCELDKDNYWNIPSPEVYDSAEPDKLDIGSLSDDWEFASVILDKSNQPLAYQLTQLAPMLRYLGEHLGEKLAKDGG